MLVCAQPLSASTSARSKPFRAAWLAWLNWSIALHVSQPQHRLPGPRLLCHRLQRCQRRRRFLQRSKRQQRPPSLERSQCPQCIQLLLLQLHQLLRLQPAAKRLLQEVRGGLRPSPAAPVVALPHCQLQRPMQRWLADHHHLGKQFRSCAHCPASRRWRGSLPSHCLRGNGHAQRQAQQIHRARLPAWR